MTPKQFRNARIKLGYTQSEMAKVLRLADSRSIRHYESGDREISGPISLLVEMILRDYDRS